MRIIISPAKKMKVDEDSLAYLGLPAFLKKTEKIKEFMQGLSLPAAKKLWACNDKIAAENFERFQNMDLNKRLTPAILSYEGIQYQYMAPAVFEKGMLDYIQEHLRILSGFYGVLRPMDGVTPYRLEMQARASIDGSKNLYDFWGEELYKEVRDESGIIINLASKEYSKAIEGFLTTEDTMITCVFGDLEDGKVVQKGTYAKMARGEMVRFMAENNVQSPEELKSFDKMGYHFVEQWSGENEFIFAK
ncbi:MAG: peroxide stress protein YaaA [Eubacteriales bacterium]|nr:peroxide stress protein YaaA [Eubacteriales bacterium]